jgi:hypothetical protein
MLKKEELISIKRMLLNVLPSQGQPMRVLAPELQAWQQAVSAVDRELKAADKELERLNREDGVAES